MQFTLEELELLKKAVFHFICDVNHNKAREIKLDKLDDKLEEAIKNLKG